MLPQQQLGDEEGAEEEEDGHAKVAEQTDVVEPGLLNGIDRHMIKAMNGENAAERKKAQQVQLGAIVAIDVGIVHGFAQIDQAPLGSVK